MEPLVAHVTDDRADGKRGAQRRVERELAAAGEVVAAHDEGDGLGVQVARQLACTGVDEGGRGDRLVVSSLGTC